MTTKEMLRSPSKNYRIRISPVSGSISNGQRTLADLTKTRNSLKEKSMFESISAAEAVPEIGVGEEMIDGLDDLLHTKKDPLQLIAITKILRILSPSHPETLSTRLLIKELSKD